MLNQNSAEFREENRLLEEIPTEFEKLSAKLSYWILLSKLGRYIMEFREDGELTSFMLTCLAPSRRLIHS